MLYILLRAFQKNCDHKVMGILYRCIAHFFFVVGTTTLSCYLIVYLDRHGWWLALADVFYGLVQQYYNFFEFWVLLVINFLSPYFSVWWDILVAHYKELLCNLLLVINFLSPYFSMWWDNLVAHYKELLRNFLLVINFLSSYFSMWWDNLVAHYKELLRNFLSPYFSVWLDNLVAHYKELFLSSTIVVWLTTFMQNVVAEVPKETFIFSVLLLSAFLLVSKQQTMGNFYHAMLGLLLSKVLYSLYILLYVNHKVILVAHLIMINCIRSGVEALLAGCPPELLSPMFYFSCWYFVMLGLFLWLFFRR